ncbi:MAG: GldG family protein [Acidobacteria bacterium]|nr:GldG family protein [Acidobacteriota bacterium]MBI3280363.1 GldG family protein [Acidobacteriota bacterium]
MPRFAWLKTRQTKFTGYVTVYILIVVAVLGLLNWLAQRHNKSFDTTANKRYSLSDQSKKIAANLKHDVKITYFDDKERFQNAKDLLDRYDTLSTKLHVEYVDPDKDPQKARVMGVRTMGTTFIEAGGRREEAKSLTEEEVTSGMIRVLKTGVRTVCTTSGSGEPSLEETGRDGYSTAKESMEKNNYRTRTISLLEKAEVPKDCTILVVAGPRLDYPQPVVDAIKKFVESGGDALFLLPPPLQFPKESTAPNDALAGVLGGWGVTLNKDLVLDTSGIGQIFGLSEVVPLVANYETQAIVREMKGVATAFAFSRSLDTKSADKTTVEKLFSTSANSYATAKLNLNSAELTIDPNKDKKGPLLLAVAGTYNTGKTPQTSGSDASPGQGRFVVVGSAAWISNSFFSASSIGNRDLFLNMLNWLSADEELISIRPKDPEDRRLSLTQRQMRLLMYTSLIALPLAAIITGIGVWWRRR